MEKPVKVLVIKGQSRYGQLRYECEEMIKGFSEQGCLVTVLDLAACVKYSLRNDWATDYDLIYSFNGIGCDLYMESEGENKGLYWTFLVDPPYHLHSRLKNLSGNVMVSCIDNNHVKYIDRFYPNIKWTCFLPHGGITGEVPYISMRERKYGIVFMGSLVDTETMKDEIADMRGQFAELVDPIVRLCETDFHSELEDLVEMKLMDLHTEVDYVAFREIMAQMHILDFYRRYIKRQRLIEKLGEMGVSVDLWGDGWEKIVEKNETLRYHGKISYGLSKWIMAEAKVVLSDMPLFHDGSHERIYAAMQCGALSVSNKSRYLEETLQDGKELLFYDDEKSDETANLLKMIIKDDERLEEISRIGHAAAEKQTWRERASDVIEIMGML